MKLTFLGTGTSFGIPVIGCRCATCTSEDPRDRRTRHAALLESGDGARRLLVDTPPELRLQLLGAGVDAIDAVWFTHEHADHTAGIDDLRVFSAHRRQAVGVWAGAHCAVVLRERFDYIFDDGYRPPEGTSKPELHLEQLRAFEPVEIAGFEMRPLPVPHGDLEAWGFRVGDLGYLTDAQEVPARVREALAGVRVLVINALWFGPSHPTHLTVEEAVAVARDIGAERSYLIHMTHRLKHADLEARLPEGVLPAYDGLTIEI